jgi:hypothetical protein
MNVTKYKLNRWSQVKRKHFVGIEKRFILGGGEGKSILL